MGILAAYVQMTSGDSEGPDHLIDLTTAQKGIGCGGELVKKGGASVAIFGSRTSFDKLFQAFPTP